MKFSVDSSGFSKGLRDFQRKIEEAAKPESVPFSALFTPAFMHSHTDSPSFEAFMSAGGYSMDADEFKAIPDAEFDQHVRKHSQFASWLAMQQDAGKIYMAAKLKRALR